MNPSLEGNILNRVFAEHNAGVWAMFVHKGSPRLMVTPAYNAWYLVRFGQAVTEHSIRELLPELNRALRSYRKDKVTCRYEDGVLEVPRVKPARLDLTDTALGGLSEYDMLLGAHYTPPRPRRVKVNLLDPYVGHIMVAGTTRIAGKTTLKRVAISTLALNTSPDRLHMVMIDLKGVGMSPFKHLPHIRGWASDHEEAGRLIRGVAKELQRRVEAESTDSTKLILVIDELADLINFRALNDLFQEHFPTIATRGAEMGIHLIVGAQNPSRLSLGAQLRTQMGIKLVGHVEDATIAKSLTGREGTGAHLLPGMGSFIYINGGDSPIRIQGYYLADVNLMVDRIRQKWGDVKLPPLVGADRKNRKFSRRDWETDLQAARPVFGANWKWVPGSSGIGGELKEGGKKAIIEAVFGKGADTGGSNNKRANEIIEHLTAEKEREVLYAEAR